MHEKTFTLKDIEEDCGEFEIQNEADNSNLISLMELYGYMDNSDKAKTKKNNLFNTDSTKELNTILKHGYSYKFHEKKQYINSLQLKNSLKNSREKLDIEGKLKNSTCSLSLSNMEIADLVNAFKITQKDQVLHKNIDPVTNFNGIKSLYTSKQLSDIEKIHRIYASKNPK